MSPADPPDDNPPDETTDSPRDETSTASEDEESDAVNDDGANKWALTREALDKLLDRLAPDREEAGKRLLAMRVRLTRYFEYQRVPAPERLVDVTVDRLAGKILAGHTITNPMAYALTVARYVWKEWLRDPERFLVDVEDIADPPARRQPDEEKEARLSCLDECLEKLTIESRKLILGYYSDEGRAKIDHRIKIAEALGIPLNALRIRAHRIRTKLEECLKNCLEGRNENGSIAL